MALVITNIPLKVWVDSLPKPEAKDPGWRQRHYMDLICGRTVYANVSGEEASLGPLTYCWQGADGNPSSFMCGGNTMYLKTDSPKRDISGEEIYSAYVKVEEAKPTCAECLGPVDQENDYLCSRCR